MYNFKDWLIANKSHIMEINDQSINMLLDRLRPHINDFAYLAKIESYEDIRTNHEITGKLQEAYNIMYQLYYPKELRCRPCEMEALCAIKDIVNNNL